MKRFFLALTLATSLASAPAQVGGPPAGINAAMLKMFGDIKAFTAKADARILDENKKEISALPMSIALRDGKLRSEMDLSEMKGGSIPPEASAMMKQAGMDKMVTIVRSDKKATVVSYPGLKSYAEVPFSETEVADAKIEITDAGKEDIDGHPCVKKKLAFADAKGRPQEAFVWQASDLKGFPLQIQMDQRKNTLILKFQQPKLEAPDASLFEMPAAYAKYNSLQELMQAAMMKMFSGAGAGEK
ncbi:MAG TPA: hypothetical protein VK846_18015 [Candidatus Limnocylindria bacterium]|nr:hypothetical protein [Candidatus Limnocylindria bacterium]